MCQYLYAAFSLKQSADEGLTAAEAEAVQRWRKQISHIATQEMLHLSLVQNLLSAIGAAPHLSRPNFPQPASHYPAGRAPGAAAVRRAGAAPLHVPRAPRGHGPRGRRRDGRLRAPRPRPARACRLGEIVPRGQDFATVGHLYRSIEAGHRAPGGEVRRAVAVRRAAAGAGHPAVLRLAGTDRGHRRGLGAAGHRRDPGAGRGPARALEGRALRPVRGDPRRVSSSSARPTRPSTRSARWSRSTSGRPSATRRPAGHRPDGPPGHGPVQRLLRDPAADAAALLRPHRGDRPPAQGAGRRERQPDVRCHQAARRPGHHAPGGPGVPGPHGRAQLRAVLRVRLRAAAPRGGLGPADRAHPPGRRLLRARRPVRPRGGRRPARGPGQPDRDRRRPRRAPAGPLRPAQAPAEDPAPCWPAPRIITERARLSRPRRRPRAVRGSRPARLRLPGRARRQATPARWPAWSTASCAP